MTAIRTNLIAKAAASFMMLLVLSTSFPVNAFADTLAVDLTANGQQALTLASSTDSFTVSLRAPGATACQMTAPATSGVNVAMTSTIVLGHPWYPAVGGSTTFTVTCTDGVSNLTDSVVVSLPSASAPVVVSPAAPVTVDIKANGSNGPVTITSGNSFTYAWTSTNATACQLTSPVASGVTLSGSSVAITPGHPFYPTTSTPTTLTITCTDGVNNATDSVVVNLASVTTVGPAAAVAVDIKANGSDGPVTITPGSSYTYSWTSTNATACQFTSPVASGATLSGTSISITPSHPFYPTSSSPTTLTITCTDGVNNATDSVVVNLGSVSTGGGSSLAVTVDVKINGVDGPVSILNGTAYTYSWTSTNATACQFTSPVATGATLSGSSISITPGHPFYPAVGGSTTFTITCTDGVNNATDSAVVNVIVQSGGGSGGSSSSTPPPSTGSSTPPGSACLFVKDYMRADFQNDRAEVIKLQTFLRDIEGHTNLSVTGVYDQATVVAVNEFQVKYRADILDPWGLKGPTGYVYILSLKKINEIYCLHTFPLNQAQANEISAFRDLVTGFRNQGYPVSLPPHRVTYRSSTGRVVSASSETKCEPIVTTVVTNNCSSTTIKTVSSAGTVHTATSTKGQISSRFATALTTFPKTLMNGLQCLYELLLILVVLYILASVLEDVLYKQEDLTAFKKRFYTKWGTVAVGLVIALVVAYIMNELCLIWPLLIALILTAVWMILYPKHTRITDSAKSWYLVTTARAKNVLVKNPTPVIVEKK